MLDDLLILLQLALVLGKLSLLSFGGNTVALGEMEREIVGRGWLTHQQFLESYAMGQVTPGPGVTRVIPMGYLTAGLPGAVVAFVATYLPTISLAMIAAVVWGRLRDSPWPRAVRTSLIPTAMGLTLASAFSISSAVANDIPALAVLMGSTV